MKYKAINEKYCIVICLFLGGAFVEIFLFTLILTNRYKTANELKEHLTIERCDQALCVAKESGKNRVSSI